MDSFCNFHDIAIALEHIGHKEVGITGRPRGDIFDADFIEIGNYVFVMLMLLYRKNNYFCDDLISTFELSSKEYMGVNGNEIPLRTACDLFQQFKDILNRMPSE